jgi:hypothetical protein
VNEKEKIERPMYRQFGYGEFDVYVVGENHCGPNHESPKSFNYEVEVRYPLDALDERGFLLDNLSFQEYFEALHQTSYSCELLATHAACTFWDMAEGRCEQVRVCIWGIREVAKVEFTCTYAIREAMRKADTHRAKEAQ